MTPPPPRPDRSPGGLADLLIETEAAQLRALERPVTVSAGSTLYEERAPYAYAFVVQEGVLILERLSSEGRRQVLAFAYPGDFMGFDLAGRYLCSAVALTDVRLAAYPAGKLTALAEQHAGIDRALKTVTSRILAFALDQICVLGRLNARERLAYGLLHLHHRQQGDDARTTGWGGIDLPMTRPDLADFLGLTPETVSRTLSKLRRDGLLQLDDHGHRATADLDGLKALLDLPESTRV